MTFSPSIYDVDRLLRLRHLVRELSPDASPRACFVVEPHRPIPRRLAVLPGSFNPPTKAHLALAEATLATGTVERVDFLLASRTVDKERIEGASLTDRLLLLEELTAKRSDLGVVLVNRGLYVDQARIIRDALSTLEDLSFVVGYDKIVQIFDPRYYHDREEALGQLFTLARIVVAPRGNNDVADLKALLERPENRRYVAGITALDLAPVYRQMASSHVRAHERGALADLPPLVAEFVRETGAYGRVGQSTADEATYRRRERALDLVEEGRLAAATPAEFRRAIEAVGTADVPLTLRPPESDNSTSPRPGQSR